MIAPLDRRATRINASDHAGRRCVQLRFPGLRVL